MALNAPPTDYDGFEMATALIRHAEDHRAKVQEGVEDIALRREDLPDGSSRVTVFQRPATPIEGRLYWETELKHCLEDLNSALDYAAVEVFERCCCKDPPPYSAHRHKAVRFPVPIQDQGRSDYEARVESDIPGLRKARPDVFSTVVGFRRYAQGNEVWLTTIHDRWQLSKHQRLPLAAEKPFRTFIGGGQQLVELPVTNMRYFTLDPPRPIAPNLMAAVNGVGQIVKELEGVVGPRKT